MMKPHAITKNIPASQLKGAKRMVAGCLRFVVCRILRSLGPFLSPTVSSTNPSSSLAFSTPPVLARVLRPPGLGLSPQPADARTFPH